MKWIIPATRRFVACVRIARETGRLHNRDAKPGETIENIDLMLGVDPDGSMSSQTGDPQFWGPAYHGAVKAIVSVPVDDDDETVVDLAVDLRNQIIEGISQ